MKRAKTGRTTLKTEFKAKTAPKTGAEAKRARGTHGISAAVHCRVDSLGVKRNVTALCDAKLLGRVLKGGGCVIDLKAYRGFYEGELVTGERAAELAANADNLNLVGEKALAAARTAIEISERNVKRVGGVPHAQAYRI